MFTEHPDRPKEAASLIAMGYWRSEREPGLPDPGDFVDETWDPRMRKLAALYLRSAKPLVHWRGVSWCRMCPKESAPRGFEMGTTCLSDGSYVWPEGLAHYVEGHGLRLPDDFMDHVGTRIRSGQFDIASAARALEAGMKRALRGR